MMDYSGKTAFIVGGSSGIGRELAKGLAARGARIAIFGRRRSMLDEALDEIKSSREVNAYAMDAGDEADAQSILAQAVREMGVPDLLINSAGGAKPQEFEKVTGNDLAWTLNANLYACWFPCRVIAPLMKQRGRGAIVNVSSMAGLVGIYGYTDYTLAKAGIIGFSEALRSEPTPFGVSVQVLCPPDTETPGFERENETKPQVTAALSEGAALMSAEDVAEACLARIGAKPFLILANRESKMIEVMRRLAPNFMRGQIDAAVAKVLARREK